jgi:hypothetical protein
MAVTNRITLNDKWRLFLEQRKALAWRLLSNWPAPAQCGAVDLNEAWYRKPPAPRRSRYAVVPVATM